MGTLLSLDTAISGTGDHENYFAQFDLNHYLDQASTLVYKNGSSVNADCEPKAVRIRSILNQRMWPTISRTTLLFSSMSKYQIYPERVQLNGTFQYHQAVKPNYG